MASVGDILGPQTRPSLSMIESSFRSVSSRRAVYVRLCALNTWQEVCLSVSFRNLPAKSLEETQRHKMEYEEMVAGAKRRGTHTHAHTHTHTHTEQLSKANCASIERYLTLPQRACWQEQFFLETFFTLCRTQSHSSLLLLLLLLWLAQTDVRWPAGTNLSKSLSLCLCLSSEVKEAQRKKRQMKERHKQEDIISNAMVIWNTEILPHWDTMYVSTSLCVCRTHSVSVCELVYLTHCVCVGRERGGSGSSGGRDFLPASGDECGASPSATSWTSRQVQTDFISSFSFFIVFFFSIFWQINYSQNTSLGSWRESVTMTVE